MNRRDALARVSLLLGGTILGAEAFLSGCNNPPEQKLGVAGMNFSNTDIAFLDEVAETREPLVITKFGKPVARLVPMPPASTLRGALKGSVLHEDDIVASLDNEWEAAR